MRFNDCYFVIPETSASQNKLFYLFIFKLIFMFLQQKKKLDMFLQMSLFN